MVGGHERPWGIILIAFGYMASGLLSPLAAMIWWKDAATLLLALSLGVGLVATGLGILHGDRRARSIALAVAIVAIGQPIFGLGRMIAETEWETFLGVTLPTMAIMVLNLSVLGYLLGDAGGHFGAGKLGGGNHL